MFQENPQGLVQERVCDWRCVAKRNGPRSETGQKTAGLVQRGNRHQKRLM